MADFFKLTVNMPRLFLILGVVCGGLLSATSVYWNTEKREALEELARVYERQEFDSMKTQLTRIEANMITLTATVKAYHGSVKAQ